MADALQIPDALAWLIVVGAVSLALLNIGKLLRFFRVPQAIGRVVSWLAHIARDAFIQGARDGIEATVSEIVRKELRPNGGVNIRDAVDRTETMVRTAEAKLDGHIAWSERVMAQNDLIHPPEDDPLPYRPRSELDDPDTDDGAL